MGKPTSSETLRSASSSSLACRVWPWPEVHDDVHRMFPRLVPVAWGDGRDLPRPETPELAVSGEEVVALFAAGFDLQLCHHREKRSRRQLAVHGPAPDRPVLQVAPGGRGFGQR